MEEKTEDTARQTEEKKKDDHNAKNSNSYYKLSTKEIYRTLAFQYKQPGSSGGLKINFLADVVANLFYPGNFEPKSKSNFKKQLEDVMKNSVGPYKDEMGEEEFCKLLDTVEKNVTDKTTEEFLVKVFRRHDKDKDGMLNREEFLSLVKNNNDYQGITDKDAENLFTSLASGMGERMGIDMKTYLKFCSYQKDE